MSDDTEAHSHQNIQHNGETYIKLADAAVTFRHLRAEITRLRAALATARREGMEEAAKIATEFEIVAHLHGPWSDVGHECAAQAAGIVAAAIRAAAGEVKP